MAKQDEQQFVRVEDYVKGELSKDGTTWEGDLELTYSRVE